MVDGIVLVIYNGLLVNILSIIQTFLLCNKTLTRMFFCLLIMDVIIYVIQLIYNSDSSIAVMLDSCDIPMVMCYIIKILMVLKKLKNIINWLVFYENKLP